MVAYNPADPMNWLGIDAELRDRAAGLNPDGSTRYTLPSMGMDPEYIAYLAQYDANRQNIGSDRDLRKKRAQLDYEQALRDLEQQGLTSARDTDTSLLGRGVYNSGERIQRQNELSTALAEGRGRADASLADTIGQTDADYERALTQLNAEREAQIVASKSRIAQTQRAGAEAAGLLGSASTPAGGGGGGGAAATTSAPPAVSRPSSLPGNPGYVHDSIRPPTASTPNRTAPKPTTPKPGAAKRAPALPKVVKY